MDHPGGALTGAGMEAETALRSFQEFCAVSQFRQQGGCVAQLVRVELDDDIPAFDELARLHLRDPVVRKIAADDGQFAWAEFADVITDQQQARRVGDQMDLDLGMEVSDIPHPGIVILAPEEGFVGACEHVFE